MINEFLQERAALYVSGAMLPQEREQFELVLEFHDELREFVSRIGRSWRRRHARHAASRRLWTFAWTQGPNFRACSAIARSKSPRMVW